MSVEGIKIKSVMVVILLTLTSNEPAHKIMVFILLSSNEG